MKIGIGIPNPVPGTPGALIPAWARRAEERGFSSLATIDRIAYPSLDSLTTLAAAAAVTSRIGLLTNILLAPVYPAPLLAKTSASIDQISGGRFALGLAAGGRADDYAVAGRDFATRGRDFDAQLEYLHRAWRGEPTDGTDKPICPTPVNGATVPILIGGSGERAIRRTLKWGEGWTAGGAPPDMVAPFVAKVRTAWTGAGRDGEPRIVALSYYSLGADAEEASRGYLLDYYGFLGDYAGMIAGGALRSEAAVRGAIKAYEDIGVTELVLVGTVAQLDQVDRLADVVF